MYNFNLILNILNSLKLECNIKYVNMFNTLYTHKTNSHDSYTHMHNEMLCTTSNNLNEQQYTTPAWNRTQMKKGGGGVTVHLTWTQSAFSSCSIEPDILCFPVSEPSSKEERREVKRGVKSWGFCTPREAETAGKERKDGKLIKGNENLVPSASSRRYLAT